MALVLVVSSPGGETRFALERVVSIGRAEDNDIVLATSEVSRHHARIGLIDGALQLVDLGSANGTTVDGVSIEPRDAAVLRAGQSFVIGSHRIVIEEETTPTSATVVLSPQGAAPGTVVVPAPAAVLVVATARGSREVPLTGDVTTLGRGATNAIVVDDPVVSQSHARIRRVPDGFEITDLGSSNGLYLAGERVGTRLLEDGDELGIGGRVTLRFQAFRPAGAPGPQRPAPLGRRAEPLVTIGREADNDLVVDHPTVSRHHARVYQEGAGAIEDLDSSNGTFVNGERIAAGVRHALQQGDHIQVGPAWFSYEPGGVRQADEGAGVAMVAMGLHAHVGKDVDLLKDISLAIHPREFVAVVGASGAGKSTLMGALTGFRPATAGTVTVNGHDLYRNFEAFRTQMGYVPQDDILHKELPVRRALDYAAQLRLPGDTTANERASRVAAVLDTLGLTDRADVRIDRLSGGQRKRVSIGAELITDPELFFLDEATSGLDPGTEGQMMRLLRKLADDGRTVILITHATKNVMLCDRVVFLAKGGHLAFFGPPDEALRYFDVPDFDGIYDRLEGESTPAEWGARFREQQVSQTAVVGPGGGRTAAPLPADERKPIAPTENASAWRQFRVLSRRYLDILVRDRVNLAILLLVAPVTAAVNFIAWPRDVLSFETGDSTRAMVMAYMLSLFPGLIGSIPPVREIVKERAIYARERAVGLRVLPYLASKAWVLVLFSLYHALMLTVITLLWVKLPGGTASDWATVYITFALGIISGMMTGLLVSGLSPRDDQAVLLVVGVVLLQVTFSGGILPLGDLGPAGGVIGAVMNSNWAFKGMVAAFDIHRGVCTGDLSGCRMPGFGPLDSEETRQVAMGPLVDRYEDVFDANLLVVWGALLAISAAFFIALYFVQRRKKLV